MVTIADPEDAINDFWVSGDLLTILDDDPDRREIVQIATATHENESFCYALCNDGTVWREAIKTHQQDGSFEHTWERLPLIPQD